MECENQIQEPYVNVARVQGEGKTGIETLKGWWECYPETVRLEQQLLKVTAQRGN